MYENKHRKVRVAVHLGAAGSLQRICGRRTFKGPRQSGTLEGLVDGNRITFHVNTRVGLDYKGTVDGDSMKGTMTAKGKSGEWTATRER